jgi:hypothetical protein
MPGWPFVKLFFFFFFSIQTVTFSWSVVLSVRVFLHSVLVVVAVVKRP